MRETPGLGDAVDANKSDWVLSFNGRSLDNPQPKQWTVRKNGGDFDQFTGATITPRAVIIATRKVLDYVAVNEEQLFSSSAHVDDTPPVVVSTAAENAT